MLKGGCNEKRDTDHTEFSTQYDIYVPKEDAQRARHVINGK